MYKALKGLLQNIANVNNGSELENKFLLCVCNQIPYSTFLDSSWDFYLTAFDT